MNTTEFCYWLQGFFEMANPMQLSMQQIAMIKKHLALVFTNVTGPARPEKTAPHADPFDLNPSICSNSSALDTWGVKEDPLVYCAREVTEELLKDIKECALPEPSEDERKQTKENIQKIIEEQKKKEPIWHSAPKACSHDTKIC